jgi:hypothetical protein
VSVGVCMDDDYDFSDDGGGADKKVPFVRLRPAKSCAAKGRKHTLNRNRLD